VRLHRNAILAKGDGGKRTFQIDSVIYLSGLMSDSGRNPPMHNCLRRTREDPICWNRKRVGRVRIWARPVMVYSIKPKMSHMHLMCRHNFKSSERGLFFEE
jgi:hypothetical protein